EKAFSIVAKSLMICMSACFLLLISERESLMAGTMRIFDIFFETISAFATVGLSLGATASLSAAGKAIVIATMFIGRTGIFAMALGFAHSEKERYFEYPSASILIG
ncbi:MAG TPA: potassium transporter TrkG, partial [Treponemataceae bacterium]|nr:potassium transporter TrkG [Treponemataceae bacterium]